MIPRDTSPAAAAVHDASQRALVMAGRLRLALELSDLTHSFAIAGIRRADPTLTEEQARIALAKRLYLPPPKDK